MSVKTDQINLELTINGSKANLTLKDLTGESRKLKAELSRLPIESEEFRKKAEQLKSVNGRIQSINKDLRGMGNAWGNIKQQLIGFGATAAAFLGFQFITSQVKNLISAQGELSDQLAEIQKTTGLTTEEVKQLNSELSKINTRTSAKGLRDIAIAAGQLGIEKENIASFTKAADELFVVMGSEFQGTATDFANELGKLRNVFSDIKSDNISEDMLHIGNALNVLAQSGVATGPVLSDFSNRIGGIGISLGLTTGQVLGLSATLQELNVSTERGGTAVGRILKAMSLHVADFAKVAGVSVEDFTALVNKDLYGAFLKVVEGSQKSADSATALSNMLDQLHIDGSGASEVFAKLSGNMGLLKTKTDLATVSLENTSSITRQFEIQNNTLGATLDKIGKKFYAAFNSGIISSAIQSLVSFAGKLAGVVDETNKATKAYEQTNTEVQNLQKNIVPLINRYNDLKSKTTLTKDEQAELKTIITQVGNTIPSAITAFDKYGNALDINSAKAKQFVRQQQLLLQLQNKQAIAEQQEILKGLTSNAIAIQAQLNKGVFEVVNSQGIVSYQKNSDELIRKQQENLRKIQKQVEDTKLTISGLSGEFVNGQQEMGDATKVLSDDLNDTQDDIVIVADKENKTDKNRVKVKEENLKDLLDQHKIYRDLLIAQMEEGDAKEIAIENAHYQDEITGMYERFGGIVNLTAEQLAIIEELWKQHVTKLGTIKENADDPFDEAFWGDFDQWLNKLSGDMDAAFSPKGVQLWGETAKDQMQIILDLSAQAVNAFYGVLNSSADAHQQEQDAALQSHMDTLDEQYNKGLINEQQYADGKAAIQAEMDSLDKEYARKKALRDRALAIFNATIDIIKAVVEYGIISPQAIGAGIVGAALLAEMIATPIPKLAKGGRVADRTIAEIGEAGYPEYVVSTDPQYRARSIGLLNMAAQEINPQVNTAISSSTGSGGGNDSAVVLKMMSANMKLMGQVKRLLEEGVEARLDYDTFNRDTARIEGTKKRAGVVG